MKISFMFSCLMVLTFAFTVQASANTVSVMKDAETGQTSWARSSKSSSGQGADSTALQPMTKEEEEAMKKYLQELQKAMAAVQGARVVSQTAVLTERTGQVKLLQTVNSLRSVPSTKDLQLVRDTRSAALVNAAPPEAVDIPLAGLPAAEA